MGGPGDDERHKEQMASGPRICPGRHLAVLQMTLLCVLAFSKFKVSMFPTPPATDPVTEVFAVSAVGKNIHVLLQER